MGAQTCVHPTAGQCPAPSCLPGQGGHSGPRPWAFLSGQWWPANGAGSPRLPPALRGHRVRRGPFTMGQVPTRKWKGPRGAARGPAGLGAGWPVVAFSPPLQLLCMWRSPDTQALPTRSQLPRRQLCSVLGPDTTRKNNRTRLQTLLLFSFCKKVEESPGQIKCRLMPRGPMPCPAAAEGLSPEPRPMPTLPTLPVGERPPSMAEHLSQRPRPTGTAALTWLQEEQLERPRDFLPTSMW